MFCFQPFMDFLNRLYCIYIAFIFLPHFYTNIVHIAVHIVT